MELTYVGAHDAVEVRIPDWPAEPTVEHGCSYDFPDEIAELLLEQPSNWQRTQPEESLDERLAKAKNHASLDALAAELGVEFDDNTSTVAAKKAVLEEAVATAAAEAAQGEAEVDEAGEAGEENE
jgi:hypothetical protein